VRRERDEVHQRTPHEFLGYLPEEDDNEDDGFERSAIVSSGAREGGTVSDVGAWPTLPMRPALPALPAMPAWMQTVGSALSTVLAHPRLGRAAGGATLCLFAGLLATLLIPTLPSTLFAVLVGPSAPAFDEAPRRVRGPLTAFPDWRPAYVGEDSRLYVVTSDGRTTLAGPALPDLLHDGAYAATASISPDGHQIAYTTRASGLVLIDLSAVPSSPRVLHLSPSGTDLHWSPDGALLAMRTGEGAVAIVRVKGDRGVLVVRRLGLAHYSELDHGAILGWSDTAHLLIARRELTAAAVQLDVVSVISGAVRSIATLPIAGAAITRFSLSPDGTQILVWSSGSDIHARSSVAVIDTSTGERRPLPAIQRSLEGPIFATVWNPDGQTLTTATGAFDPSHPENISMQAWQLNAQADTAVHQPNLGIPLGWTPDSGSLIFGRMLTYSGAAMPKLQLRSWSLSARTGRPLPNLIAQATQSLPFLGFVRTA